MAEGLARAMAPKGTDIFSAGSAPTRVRPQAIEACGEIGISIDDQTSKAIDEVPINEMDLVITLCADEVCPIVPSTVRHLHWPLPDPAGAGDSPGEELNAFRSVRNELKERIGNLFADWN